MFLQGRVVGKTDAAQGFVVGSGGNARARESGGGFLHVLRCLEILQKGRLTLLSVGW